MSALTPDEEAELAALTRTLFAPDATLSAADQARFTDLDARRRAATQPVLPTASMVPQTAAHVIAEPSASAENNSEPFAPAENASEPLAVAQGEASARRIAGEKPPRRQYSRRARVWSAVAGFALASAVIFAVQWELTPHPMLHSTAVEISADDLSDLGVEQNVHIEGMTDAGDMQLLLVDAIPGVFVVIVESVDGVACMSLSAQHKTDLDIPISKCRFGGGPLILDFPMAIVRDAAYAETLVEADMHRIVYRDRVLTLWDNPSSAPEDY